MSDLESLLLRILSAQKKGATAFRTERGRIMSALERGEDPKLLFTDSRRGEWSFGADMVGNVADMLAIVGATVTGFKWLQEKAARTQERSSLRAWWRAELIARGLRPEEAAEIEQRRRA